MFHQDNLMNQRDSDYRSDAVQRFFIRLILISILMFIIFVVVGGLNLDYRPGSSPPFP